MAADPNECWDHNEAAVIPGLHRSLQKLHQMFEQWIARESGSDCSLYLASLAITFGGQLPSIFLGSQTAPHGRELLVCEGRTAALLASPNVFPSGSVDQGLPVGSLIILVRFGVEQI